MKNGAPKSAYLGWLATAMATDGVRSICAPDDLVLGYATGYDAAMIAPFVRSLREYFDGPVALVVDDRPDVVALLAEHGIEAVHPEHAQGWEPHPVMARFAAYSRLLERYPNAVDVLLTDVRDVVFQAEPFGPPPRRLEVFVEYEGKMLGDHAFNMKYLSALVGDEMAATLADKPCICVGTVMGPRDEIVRFCRTVLMLAAIPRSEIGGCFGADQAACNIAVHMGLVKAEIQPNFGRIATIGMTPGDTLSFRDGRVINPDGGFSAIVHQHDRHPHLDQAVHDLWGQGMRHCERVKPRSAVDRGKKLRQSLMRRLPELR
ncbi:lipooligosaccharide outer core biosynthesis glycosyltransferase GtrOC6 [soil metagenome]